MDCTNCGNPVSIEAKYCGHCGTAIKSVPKKEKFLSMSGESVFGIRFIKTRGAKIITGLVMLALAAFTFLDPELNDMGVLIVILLVGGIWYIYKGIKTKSNNQEVQTSGKMNKRLMLILVIAIVVGVGILVWATMNTETTNINVSSSSTDENNPRSIHNEGYQLKVSNLNFEITFPEEPEFHRTDGQDFTRYTWSYIDNSLDNRNALYVQAENNLYAYDSSQEEFIEKTARIYGGVVSYIKQNVATSATDYEISGVYSQSTNKTETIVGRIIDVGEWTFVVTNQFEKSNNYPNFISSFRTAGN